jgi:hypothetical protein
MNKLKLKHYIVLAGIIIISAGGFYLNYKIDNSFVGIIPLVNTIKTDLFGAITTINSTDTLKDSRSVINNNFSYLNSEVNGKDALGQATSTLASHTSAYNHANYNTAYAWGDWHAPGFLTTANGTSTYVARGTWTSIDDYPSACTAGQYVSAIGDTLTCGTPAGGGGSGATTTINNVDGPTFTFTARTTGSSFSISTTTGTVYFNLPDTLETQAQASSSFSLTTHNHATLYDILGQATSTLSSHTTTYNHTNYNTAYAWGDWHTPGFLTTALATSSYLSLTNWFATTTHSLISSLPALATVGTITSGTWNGTAISAIKGGTGLTSFNRGSLLYASADNTWAALASSTKGSVISISATGYPSYVATSTLNIDLANTTGTLTVTRGGTGLATISRGSILYASADNTLSALASSTVGYVLSISATGYPAWASTSSLGMVGGSGSQTPWTSNINGGNYSLSNVNAITASSVNAIVYIDPATSGDFGTKMNAAYSALPSSGGEIRVKSGTTSAWTVPIVFGGNEKPVKMSCDPGAVLTFTPSTGTSTTFNIRQSAGAEYGLFGCDIQGPSVGAGSTTVGVVIGGDQGAQGITLKGNHISKFGTGLRTRENTWSIKILDNTIENNDRNVHIFPENNSGENYTFANNNISDCVTVNKCFFADTDGSVALNLTDNVFDNAQVYISDGNANVNMVGGSFENPDYATYGRYVYLYLAKGVSSNMTITGTEFTSPADTLAQTPSPYIMNGINLVINNSTVNSNVSSPSFVVNYDVLAYLTVNGFMERSTAIDAITTSTRATIISSTNEDLATFGTGGITANAVSGSIYESRMDYDFSEDINPEILMYRWAGWDDNYRGTRIINSQDVDGSLSFQTDTGANPIGSLTLATRMIIAGTTGYIGIATNTPAYNLDVYGTGRFTGSLKVGAYTLPSTDGTSGYVLKTNGAGALTWQSDNTSAGGVSNLIATSSITNMYFPFLDNGTNNLGIGTSSPEFFIDYYRNDSWEIMHHMSDGGQLSYIFATTTSDAFATIDIDSYLRSFEIHADDSLNFFTVGTSRLKINNSGSVGIATQTPAYKLDVYGDFRAGTAGNQFTINTVGQASSTALTVSGTSYLTNATVSTSLKIPTSATLSITASGEIGLDTTSGQLRYNDGTATRTLTYIQPSTFTVASTTWTSIKGTATSSIPLGIAPFAESWDSLRCITDTGTAWVQIGDGTNKTESIQASTTAGGFTSLSTNNTFTANETRYVEVGTFATAPNFISCTVKKSASAD